MGLLSFIKGAGEKLFKHQEANAATPAPAAPDVNALNATAANAILKYIGTQNLPADKLTVSYDGASATVTVQGTVPDQATREKIVLCCGNVSSVEHVNDQMSVTTPAPQATFYTVKSGDTLSKISKEVYGDGNKYNIIFQANQPMLSSPDKIYPGQTLRIPASQA